MFNVSKICPRTLQAVFSSVIRRQLSTDLLNVELLGRDITSPDYLSAADVKELLWTAESLKSNRTHSNLLNGQHVTFLFKQPNLRVQIAFERAAQDLGAGYSSCVFPESEDDASDCGRLVSSLTDCIVTCGIAQYQVEEIAEGAKTPVVNVLSDIYSQMNALTDLFTLLEVIGPLKRKVLAWVGPPTALCNTFIYLAPKLKLDLRLFSIFPKDAGKMSAVQLDHGLSRCRGQSEIHQCASLEEVVYRADVVAVANHSDPRHCLTAQVLEEAALEWYVLHSLPHSGCELSDHVYRHKNNLTWLSASNTKYLAMALLLRVLKPYEPNSPKPDFDGQE